MKQHFRAIICAIVFSLFAAAAACAAPSERPVEASVPSVAAVDATAADAADADVADAAVVAAFASSTPVPPPPPPSPTPLLPALPSPVPTPFRIIWISDTQDVVYSHPEDMPVMGRWIADCADRGDVAYVVQTGDAVENGFNPRQWQTFCGCLDEFSGKAPFFMIAGNHEIDVRKNSYDAYLALPWVASLPPMQTFEGGKAAYATFTAGGTDFLLLGAGWDAELDAVPWMQEVLKGHPDHVAILLFHGFLTSGGKPTVIGKALFPVLVAPNPNVRLVLCGHVLGRSGSRTDGFDDDGDGAIDRTATILMYNYQDHTTDYGQLRTLHFDPMTREITVSTYSPVTERFYRDHSQHGKTTFTLPEAF